MARSIALLLTMVLSMTALAGCTDNGSDADDDVDPTPEPTLSTPATTTPATTTPVTSTPAPTPSPVLDSSTYALAAAGMPSQAKPGKLNFTLFVNGSVTHATDHVGAHYADNDTTDPPVAPGRKDCEHSSSATLPGVFLVNCTIADEGIWYVWGHARINDSGELRNWWVADPFIVKVRDYNVTISGVPTSATASRSNFSVTVAIAGKDNATSDHIGVHYWNATTTEPSVSNAEGACEHVAGGAVNTYTVVCSITNTGVGPQQYYLRGHLRLAEGGTVLSWWSAETPVTILGVPSLPG